MSKIKIGKKAKIFTMINIIIIIYIFTLTIGYSFFKETLNIVGTVSADNPDLGTCPLVMREINNGSTMLGTLGSDGFKRYFLEKQDYDLLYTSNPNNTTVSSKIIDFYDSDNNIYSFLSSNLVLYPNDENNNLNLCEENSCLINEYKTLSKPMYFVFENTTAYPLENFIIEKDTENDITPKSPLENFDIRWAKFDSISSVIDTVKNQSDDVSVWNNFTSIFNNYLTTTGTGNYGSYYSYSDFYNLTKMSFSTQTINTGEFLVIGIYFNDVEQARFDNWPSDYEISREFDGLSFKFHEEKFESSSAFKMRFAFISESQVSNFYLNIPNGFYSNLSGYSYPVDWWQK